MSLDLTAAKQSAVKSDEELQLLYRNRAQAEHARDACYASVFPRLQSHLESELGPVKVPVSAEEIAATERALGELVALDVELANLNETITVKQAERDQKMKDVLALLSANQGGPQKSRSLAEIATEIRADWSKQGRIDGNARLYLDEMASLNAMADDAAEQAVVYFLNNAHHWQGETARRVKAELRAMLPKRT